MASINATTSSGIVATADNTGQLQLQSAGTTAATFNSFGIGLGSATPSSGIGITFPAAQSASSDANTLDDYEEGTWTPTVQGTSTAGAATYTTRVGRYTKIGNTVNVMCSLGWSAHTGSGDTVVAGLPFTSATYSLNAIWPSSIFASGMNFGTSATQLVGLITETSDAIIFRGMINNATRATVP